MQRLPPRKQSLYRAGVENRLYSPLIFILEFAQIRAPLSSLKQFCFVFNVRLIKTLLKVDQDCILRAEDAHLGLFVFA